MSAIQRWFTLLISQWILALPWLLGGVLISSTLLICTPRSWWEKFLPHKWWALLWGLGLGFLLPVGQYGAIPVMRRLLWQGATPGLAIAFWLTASLLHPIVLWQVWYSLSNHQEIFVIYTGLSIVITLLITGVFLIQRQKINHRLNDQQGFSYPAISRPASTLALLPEPTQGAAASGSKLIFDVSVRPSRLVLWWQNTATELLEWIVWLFLGCAVASLVQSLVSSEQWLDVTLLPTSLRLLGLSFFTAPGFLYDPAIADHWLQTFDTASGVSFLLMGTVLNIQTLFLLVNAFRLKAMVYAAILLLQIIILMSLWLEFYVF